MSESKDSRGLGYEALRQIVREAINKYLDEANRVSRIIFENRSGKIEPILTGAEWEKLVSGHHADVSGNPLSADALRDRTIYSDGGFVCGDFFRGLKDEVGANRGSGRDEEHDNRSASVFRGSDGVFAGVAFFDEGGDLSVSVFNKVRGSVDGGAVDGKTADHCVSPFGGGAEAATSDVPVSNVAENGGDQAVESAGATSPAPARFPRFIAIGSYVYDRKLARKSGRGHGVLAADLADFLNEEPLKSGEYKWEDAK